MIRTSLAAAGLAALGLAVADAQSRFDAVQIQTTDLGDGIHMLVGAGGNLAVSVGEDGAFLVDDQFAPLTDKIQAAIDAVAGEAGGDVRFVLNTHYHGDHTGGNEAFAGKGATVVAHDNVRVRLSSETPSTLRRPPTPPAPEGAWPVVTFSETMTFHMNGETVKVVHLPNGHTDGDSVVHFVEPDIIHAGDLMFTGMFPYIDTAAGGSVDGFIAALEAVVAMGGPDTTVVPGHGRLSTMADVEASIAMLKEARTILQGVAAEGLSPVDAVAAKPLAKFDAEWSWAFIDTDTFTRVAYEDVLATRGE